jgi:hypothetical protein
VARPRRGHRARERSGAARWHRQRDLAGGLGVAAVAASAPIEPDGGGARRSGAELTRVVARRGEAAPVMDDADGLALQCWGRREKVRGESIWSETESAIVLTDNGR